MSEELFKKIDGKKWFDAVGYCIQDFARGDFSLQEFLTKYEEILREAKPLNNSVAPTVRRVMQELRDAEIIEFVDNAGNYRCVDFIDKPLGNHLNTPGFNLELRPKPNTAISELTWREGQQAFYSPFAQEHKNRIGQAGELAVIESEIQYLTVAGRADLAKNVEHISKTKGDDEGYDILSFDIEANEKWIEVKTTTGHANRRFHISENQLSTSEREPGKYWLYRLYHFQTGTKSANYYQMHGALRLQLELSPTEYLALPR